MVCSILSRKDLASSKQLNTLIISRVMTHLLYLNSIFHMLFVCLFILNSLFRKYQWTKCYLDRDKGNLRSGFFFLVMSFFTILSLYSIVHNQQLKISRPLAPSPNSTFALITLPPKRMPDHNTCFLVLRKPQGSLWGVCILRPVYKTSQIWWVW